jgi:hypothetical protein
MNKFSTIEIGVAIQKLIYIMVMNYYMKTTQL